MGKLPFIDAHVHLWDLGRIPYPWLTPPFAHDGPNGSVAAIARDYLLDDYLADAAGWDVRGIVHVEAGADPARALDETDWLQDIAAARGLPNAIVAFTALDDPDVERLLARQAERPRVRGIRQIVNWHADPRRSYTPRDVTRDPAWQAGLSLLAGYGLSFDLQAYPGQFAGLAETIARQPGLSVILNHAGMCLAGESDGPAIWRAGMARLAALPNVAVKISGMGFVRRDWTIESVREIVLATIDLFGADRTMFASDFPTDKLFAGFDSTLGAYAAIVADFSEAERHALFARNANRLYRLDLDV